MKVKDFKVGDTVLVRAQVQGASHYYEGNLVHFASIDAHGDIIDDSSFSLFENEMAAVVKQDEVKPKPKYDPCRKFRKGDVVRVVEWNGRDIARIGQIGRVVSDEHYSKVELAIDGWTKEVYYSACHLELVASVEELEPYYIEEETFDYEIRNANDDPDIGTSMAFHIKFQDPEEGQILSVKSYYESYVYPRQHAEADAEAECKRLNDEWQTEVCRSDEGKEEDNG